MCENDNNKLVQVDEDYDLTEFDDVKYVGNEKDALGDYYTRKILSGEDCINPIKLTFSSIPKHFINEYEGSYYVGVEGNPYAVLVKGVPNEKGIVKTHKDTVIISDKAFEEKGCGEWNKISFNTLIIGPNVRSLIGNNALLKINELLIFSKSESFKRKDITWFKDTTYIFMPNIPLSEIKYSEIKPNLIAGYLKYKDCLKVDDAITSGYEKYINSKFNTLYEHGIKATEILDYLINNKLIPFEDIRGILDKTKKDSYAQKKIEEYRDSEFTSIDDQDLDKLIDAVKKKYESVGESEVSVPKISKKRFTERLAKPRNIAVERKFYNDVRARFKIGDIYAASYFDEVLLTKVVNIGDQYHQRVELKLIAILIGGKQYDLTLYDDKNYYYDNGKLLSSTLPALASDCKAVGQVYFDYTESIILLGLISEKVVNLPNSIILTPNLGLFSRVIYNGELINITSFDNSSDAVAGKEMIDFFEPFFFSYNPYGKEVGDYYSDEIDRDFIVFKKVQSENLLKAAQELYAKGRDLLLYAEEVKCATQMCFDSFNIVGEKYTNQSGKTYLLTDILKFILNMLAVSDRSLTEKMVVTYFSDFYQRTNDIKYEGFSGEEIKYILNKFFRKDLYGGFYPGYDTSFIHDGKFYVMDEEWLGLFYDAVNRCKNAINCLSDLPIYQRNQNMFRLQSIPGCYFNMFVEFAKQAISKDRFFEIIKRFIVSI